MSTGFATVPAASRFALANTTVPAVLMAGGAGRASGDGLVRTDIVVDGGRIAALGPAPAGIPRFDLDGGMAWPCFTDMHTHLDKGHILPRRGNPDGTFESALKAVEADRAENWNSHDVAARMDFGLRTAYAHGTALIRTHIDSDPPQHRISLPVFAEMRDRWEGRVDLQGVSIFAVDAFREQAFADDIVSMIADIGGVLGAFVYPTADLERLIETMMLRAANRGLDLDFHVDETGDPAAHGLRIIADAALRVGFPGTIVAGHCCSLAAQPEAEAAATMDRVAEAGIAVVSLPMCNMYLQDRSPAGEARRTPRWRGVAPVHELAARGVRVAVASDNTRDPFYDWGDLDMVEVFREAVRILQLDHPIAEWGAAVARTPAEILGRPDRGILATDNPADLVLFRARTFDELLARPQSDRTVLRNGRAIDTSLPDFRELDEITGARP